MNHSGKNATGWRLFIDTPSELTFWEPVMESTDRRICPQQLSALLKEHGRGLEVYAAQWSLHPEDCVQEAFVKLAAISPPPENSVAWLFKVTRNQAISALRSSKRRKQHESFASWLGSRSSKSADPAHILDETEERERIVSTMDQLDEAERELVVMRIWSGLTWSQITELTGSSSSSAQRNYVAAIEKIKTILESSCVKKPN